MSKYGEPWKTRYIGPPNKNWLIDNNEGRWIQEAYSHKDHTVHDRIVACVNALEGCPDPQAFVEAMRKLMIIRDQLQDSDPLRGLHPEAVEALSWLKEDKP